MFKISVDQPRNLVEIAVEGFLDEAEVSSLCGELGARIETEGMRPGSFLIKIDVTKLLIQSQEVIALSNHVIQDARLSPRKMAFCTGRSLYRMQARRLDFPFPAQLFDTSQEALAWLFDDEDVTPWGMIKASASAAA